MEYLELIDVVKKGKPHPDSKDSWSDCGQVFFTGGRGYGPTPNGSTICLGNQEDILTAFNTGEPGPGFMGLQRQVLMNILEYRKEEGIGTTNTGAAGMERAGDTGASRHKPKATGLSASRKRLPLRPPRAKNKTLSGR